MNEQGKTKSVTFRLTEEEHNYLYKRSIDNQKTLSSYIKNQCLLNEAKEFLTPVTVCAMERMLRDIIAYRNKIPAQEEYANLRKDVDDLWLHLNSLTNHIRNTQI